MGLKTTGLPATTSVIATDLVAVVTDPPGTPTSKRITAQHLANSLATLAGSVDAEFVEGEIEAAVEALAEDLAGGVVYQGTWNATTNSPTIPSAAIGNKGHYYKVATAGTTNIGGISDWQVGDVIVSNGASWDKWDHTTPAASTSVAGIVELATSAEMKTGSSASLVPSVQAVNSVHPYTDVYGPTCEIFPETYASQLSNAGGTAELVFTGDGSETTGTLGPLSRVAHGNAKLTVDGVEVATGTMDAGYGSLSGTYAEGAVNCTFEDGTLSVNFANPPENGHDVVIHYDHALAAGQFNIVFRSKDGAPIAEEVIAEAWIQDDNGDRLDLKSDNVLEVVDYGQIESGSDPFIVLSYSQRGDQTRTMKICVSANNDPYSSIGVINHGGAGPKNFYLVVALPSGRLQYSSAMMSLPQPPV